MKKLVIFAKTFGKSISSPKYYLDIVKAPFSFSLKYFLFLWFLVIIGLTTYFSVKMVTELRPALKELPEQVKAAYPAELEVAVKNGQVSVNQPEPYAIPISDSGSTQNMVVIDTQAEVEDLYRYDSWILVTDESISVRQDNGEIRTFSLQEIEELTINQGLVDELVVAIEPYLKWVVPGMIVFLFLGLSLGLTGWAFWLAFFYSLVGWFAGKAVRLPYSFGKVIQITLHALTLPTVVRIAFWFLPWDLPAQFLVYLGLYLGMFLLVARQLRIRRKVKTVNKWLVGLGILLFLIVAFFQIKGAVR